MGGGEHQQILNSVLVSAVIVVNAELYLDTEGLPELLVLFTLVVEHLFQLALDRLFNGLCNGFELVIVLEHFTGDVQRQVCGIYQTSYK